ncbi:MAG: tandem-95 repeat protein, partial [Verrucomicrobiales bacterium]|nr:tandem-95 repeat protein [Verrucomicrobiales bacterium]
MNYFLQIEDAAGKIRLVPIADIKNIPVIAGDNIIVMDEQGNPVDVSLRPDGKNLVIDFKNGESVILDDFYNIEEGAEPITISLNPKEPVDAGYEFNSQTGNLPNAKSFTLMRFSNTEYVNFVEQIDELSIGRSGGLGAPSSMGGGGGSGGNENMAPDAVDDTSVTDQNTTLVINVLGNDSDPNPNDALIISGVDQPDKGSVTVNSSSQIVFDPGDDFDYLGAGESAIVTFNYSIFDGNGGTDTATVTLTVNGVDDVTDTTPDTAVTDENTPITINVLANDSDSDANDVLTIDSVTQPAPGFGSVINNGTDLTFDPGSDFDYLAVGETATVTFTYTTNTGITETVTVTINGVNDAPVAFDDAETTDQDSTVNIDLIGGDGSISPDWDPDGDALVISQINGVIAGGTITLPSGALVTVNANGTVDYNPNGAFDSLDSGESAIDTFSYTISDGNGGTATATATVTVNGIEDATVTAPDAAVTNEDTPVTIDVLANDTDPDTSDIPLTITSVTQPALGTVVNNGSNVTFNPGGDFQNLAVGETATVTFTYTTDTGATENVTVTINGVNDGPDAIDDARTTDQDTPLVIDAISNDNDADTSDTLLITGVDQPSRGTASVNSSNQIAFDPGNDFDDLDAGESATVTFNYSISDGHGGTDTATITVTVNGVEDATVTAPDAAVTNEDTPIVIDVLANDTDPDTSDIPLTITSVTQPALGTVVNNGSNVTFNPGAAFNNLATGETATVTFTYTTDTGATENVTVTINGTNDAPDAINDARTTDQDTPLIITALSNDTDPDASDVLLITGVDQPVRGSASINANNQVVFDPGNDFDDLDAGESATVTFNYSISDGHGGTDTATITVTVNGVEDATVTAPDAAVT